MLPVMTKIKNFLMNWCKRRSSLLQQTTIYGFKSHSQLQASFEALTQSKIVKTSTLISSKNQVPTVAIHSSKTWNKATNQSSCCSCVILQVQTLRKNSLSSNSRIYTQLQKAYCLPTCNDLEVLCTWANHTKASLTSTCSQTTDLTQLI